MNKLECKIFNTMMVYNDMMAKNYIFDEKSNPTIQLFKVVKLRVNQS